MPTHADSDTQPGPPRAARWLRAHPDSMVGRGWVGVWLTAVNLVWLFYVVAAPIFVPGLSRLQVVAGYLTIPIFLVLYYRAYYGPRARLVWNVAALAVLALATVALNTSWSYVIYAGVLIGFCTTPRRAIGWLALLLVGFYAVMTVLGFHWVFRIGCVATAATISMLTLAAKVNAERQQALQLSHDEVRRLAATAERERIGRDLHDLLGHTLSLIALKSELADKLWSRDADTARAELQDVQRITRQALAQMRSAVTGIRSTGLAAEAASSRLLLEAAGIKLEEARDPVTLAPEVEDALALTLREAVTNVQRHALARSVELSVREQGAGVELVVADDGRGGISRFGNGLRGLRERLAVLGGELHVESPKGGGTRLVARVPRAADADAVQRDAA